MAEKDCPECGGSGKETYEDDDGNPHERSCRNCGGSGKVPDDE